MPAEDARREPLKQIVVATALHQRRNAIVYGAAGVILIVLGSLVAQPHLQLWRLRSQAVGVSETRRTGRTVPRITKLTSTLISMRPRRTSSLVSPTSAADACVWNPHFFNRSAACRSAALMRASALSRDNV